MPSDLFPKRKHPNSPSALRRQIEKDALRDIRPHDPRRQTRKKA